MSVATSDARLVAEAVEGLVAVGTILLALGIPPDQALGTVRLSVGRTTTIEDATTAAARLAEGWRSLQQSEPVRVLRRARR